LKRNAALFSFLPGGLQVVPIHLAASVMPALPGLGDSRVEMLYGYITFQIIIPKKKHFTLCNFGIDKVVSYGIVNAIQQPL
jgi:hypothetical protein